MSDEQQLLPIPSKEARQWAMFCHLSALLGIWIPFGTLIGPLILWQMKREMLTPRATTHWSELARVRA